MYIYRLVFTGYTNPKREINNLSVTCNFYKKSIEKVISSILFFFLWYTKIECMFEKVVSKM